MIRQDYIYEAINFIDEERLESSNDIKYIEKYFNDDEDPLTEEEVLQIKKMLIDKEMAAKEEYKRFEEEEAILWQELEKEGLL